MTYKPAIVVAAYNRVQSLERLLAQIKSAVYSDDDIPLIISIDYCDGNEAVVKSAESFQWEHGTKYIKTHNKNLGLKKHLLECGDYALEYGCIILLEDDLFVAPYYYEYVKNAQSYYAEDERIAGVSLYGHVWNANAAEPFQPIHGEGDVYFGQLSCTWGQSWTRGQWSAFRNWYAKHSELINNGHLPAFIYTWKGSWGKHFVDYIVEMERFYVIPYSPLSTVFDEVGTHSKFKHLEYQARICIGKSPMRFVPFEKGVHYDVFYENIDLKKFLARQVGSDDICVDLYASKSKAAYRNRYLLTLRKLSYKIVKSYGLELRPHDMNILFDNKGTDIFLYDRKYKKVKRKNKDNPKIMYDFAGRRPRKAIFYAIKLSLLEHPIWK